MYSGLVFKEFWAPVEVDDVVEGTQRLPINPEHAWQQDNVVTFTELAHNVSHSAL